MANEPASASRALEVPDEPGVYWCARHRKVKTRLRCGRCETPICPKCTKIGPTGARCPDCVSNRGSHVYQVSPLQYLTTFVAAVVLNIVGAVLIPFVGVLILFYAPVVGTLLGKTITLVTRGKRGIPLAVVASLGAVLGAMIPFGATWLSVLALSSIPQSGPPGTLSPAVMPVPWYQMAYLLVYLALVIPALWWWIK